MLGRQLHFNDGHYVVWVFHDKDLRYVLVNIGTSGYAEVGTISSYTGLFSIGVL